MRRIARSWRWAPDDLIIVDTPDALLVTLRSKGGASEVGGG